MHQALGLLLVFCAAAAGVAVLAAWAGWWFDVDHRTQRALSQILGAAPDAAALASPRGQGVGLRLDQGRIAVVRGVGDPGLVYDLGELLGVELIYDGVVAARMFRGEARRPLDQVSPPASRVSLRLVFDDVRDPEFELMLLAPEDAALRRPPNPAARVQEGRRWFGRLEAILRRGGS
jgi:hypothetical protein